ncbi:molybdopterin-dependent oxidoreductase [Geodermatophilus sp. SYSU D00804]
MSAALPSGTAAPAGPRTRTTETHCPYCSLQCGTAVTAGDRPATLVPLDSPTNRGRLCSKGWSATELLDHPERLTRPLVRAVPGDRTSPLVQAGWDEAFDRVVAVIGRTRARYGRDAVGCFGGGSLTPVRVYPVREVEGLLVVDV